MTKTIVITGASNGVGAAAARRLALEGARVIVVGRDPQRTAAVATEIGAEHHLADFADLNQVRNLAEELARLERIDVLANNAGGMFGERRTTVDGFERTFQVNHLAPFLLTNLLMPKLIESGASVIATASAAHYRGHLKLDDLQSERRWNKWQAYSNAKLANVAFTRALNRRYVLQGVNAACFHPGVVASGFGKDASGLTERMYASKLAQRVLVTPEDGADTLCWLAQRTPPRDWAPGQYYAGRRIRSINKQVRSDAFCEAFWDVSATMLGL